MTIPSRSTSTIILFLDNCSCEQIHFHDQLGNFLKLLLPKSDLDKNDLLSASGDEVAAWIVGALVNFGKVIVVFGLAENTFGAAQHDRHSAYGQAVANNSLLTSSVLNVHRDRGSVGHVPQTAVMGCNRLGNAKTTVTLL